MTHRVEPSSVEAYRSAREHSAAADLSAWTVLRLRGPDTRGFLQGMATQECGGDFAGGALSSLFLNEKGRPVALAWISIAHDGETAWILADEGARGTLRGHFERFRVMEDVEIDGPDGMPRAMGLLGPDRAALLGGLAATTPASTPIQGDPLSFLLLPGDGDAVTQARAGSTESASRVGSATFEAWRMALGIPRTGIDFDLDRIATELSLPEAISMTKGCYVGQEVVSRTSIRGQVRRRRVGFRFDWAGAPIPARAEIRLGDAGVGFVTSTVREPGTDLGLGMGYVATDALAGNPRLAAVDGPRLTHLRIQDWPL